MKLKKRNKAVQSGFTLVELIIVIVIVGIMAAVAIPKLANTSAAAYESVQDATLGALKSAWSTAYAVKKSAPTMDEIAAQMSDPVCTSNIDKFTCANVKFNDGTGLAVFTATLKTVGTESVVEEPGNIKLTKRAP